MLTFAWYLLKVMLVSGILFSYYWIALRNKKFHLYNRFYLLAAVGLSWLIPLFRINFWEETAKQPQVINLLTIVTTGDRYVERASQFKWDWNVVLLGIIIITSLVFLIQLLAAVVKIKRLINSNPTKKWNDICFVFTNATGTPFSFFKYIFWNEQVDLTSAEGKQILKHELTHVHENHTTDKLILSIILIGGWYNPFFWFIRKELNMIHEFIADQRAVNEGDVHSFAMMLLKTAYPAHTGILTNSFFHSPIKRRLLMLTSSKNTSFNYLRRIAILPLIAFATILFAFTVKKESVANQKKIAANLADGDYQDTTFKRKRSNTAKVTIDNRDTTIIVDGANSRPKTKINISDKGPKSDVNKTLVVLDGKEMSWQQFEKKDVKPERIQRMDVLKGKSATDKYGQKGKDGVIEITLKGQIAEQDKWQAEQQKFKADQNKFEGEQNKFKTEQKKFEAEQKKFEDERGKQEQESKYSRVFTQVENAPSYPNGITAFTDFVNTNMLYPKDAIKAKVEGAVLIQFIVNEEGKLTGFKKITNKGYGLEDEAIRLLKISGDWQPGVQNGRKVPVQVQQQVVFTLPKIQ